MSTSTTGVVAAVEVCAGGASSSADETEGVESSRVSELAIFVRLNESMDR